MGRPRKNVEATSKHLTKEEIAVREKQEEFIGQLASDSITPPRWLSTRAKKIFKQIVTELDPIQILANVDIYGLSVLSDAVDKFITATISLNTSPMTVVETTKNGVKDVPSPYIRIQKGFSEIILKYSTSFGLTPAARQKIININFEPKSDEDREFESKFGDI